MVSFDSKSGNPNSWVRYGMFRWERILKFWGSYGALYMCANTTSLLSRNAPIRCTLNIWKSWCSVSYSAYRCSCLGVPVCWRNTVTVRIGTLFYKGNPRQMTFHRRSSSLKKIVNYCMSLTAVRYLLLGQRDTWTLELCCLESPVNKWWNLRTRNRKVRVVTQIISRVFLKQKLKKVISPRQGVSSKGVTRDWRVPFLVFKVFSLGFAWFFFSKALPIRQEHELPVDATFWSPVDKWFSWIQLKLTCQAGNYLSPTSSNFQIISSHFQELYLLSYVIYKWFFSF